MTTKMAVASVEFRKALAQFGSGVAVVTTKDREGRPLGLTVTAFSSVSLDPPLVLVCIDNRSETRDGFETSWLFGVSILAEGQENWSELFAVKGPEKFRGRSLLIGPSGVPLVPGALAQIECRIASALPGGDHTIYLGEVTRVAVAPGRPLLYHAAGYRRLAKENRS